MTTKLTRKTVVDTLVTCRVYCDQVTFSKGVFTVRRGFYYRHGKTVQDLENVVKTAFPDVVIIDSGEVWKPFRGGASVATQSHWFVKFMTKDEHDRQTEAGYSRMANGGV